MSRKIWLILIGMVAVIGLIACLNLSDREVEEIDTHSVNDSDVILQGESVCHNNDWRYIRLGTVEYAEINNIIDISSSITAEEYDNIAGLFQFHDSDGNIAFAPVYPVCINDENDSLEGEDYQTLSMQEELKPVRLNRNQPTAYYIFYVRKSSGDILKLGTGMLKAISIEKTCLNCTLEGNEAYDYIEYTFEMYPNAVVKEFAYGASLTSEMDKNEHFIQLEANDADTPVADTDPFVQHSINTETLDDGWEWIGEQLTGAAKITPAVVVHLEDRDSDRGEIGLSIDKLQFKVNSFKSYELNHRVMFDIQYRNHSFM